MVRHLSITEQRIPGSERASYLASLPARLATATESKVQFWVFEHASDPDRFVEFVEGRESDVVARVAGVEQGALWRGVEVG